MLTPQPQYLRMIWELRTMIMGMRDVQAQQGAFGLATVPTLTLLAPTATVQVTIKPDRGATPAAADCAALIYGTTTILAGVSVTAVTPVSGSRVDVTVQLVGVASISGGAVFVHVA